MLRQLLQQSKKNPISDNLNYKSKQRRRNGTLRTASAIHGAANDLSPTLDGIVDTNLGKLKANTVLEKIFNSKKSQFKCNRKKIQNKVLF